MSHLSTFCTISILCLLIISCGEPEPNTRDYCRDHFLEEFDMKVYTGEDLGCKTHIRLYEHEDVFFALMINHCADFVPFTIYDCEGNEFCFTSIGPCYIQESIDYGIIGIAK